MITSFPSYNQQNYPEQLGTWEEGPQGATPTIAMYGCAISCVSMCLTHFGKLIDPSVLNQALVNVNGYASNGSGALNLVKWGAVATIYSEISLAWFERFATTPANMPRIDDELSKNYTVMVGFSFTHNVNHTAPTHYVVLYRRNEDGTYQMIDPWTGENSVFDRKYAVNGMNVSQAILQVIVYHGPVPSPAVAAAQQAQTDTLPVLKADFERMRGKCDRYDEMDAAGYHALIDIDKRVQDLIQQKNEVVKENEKLKGNVIDAERRASALAGELAKKAEEDATAIESGLDAQHRANDVESTLDTVAKALKSSPDRVDLLDNIAALLDRLDELKRATRPQIINKASDVKHSFLDSLFGWRGVKN